MDPRRETTAADVVNNYSEEELTRIFREYGEEPAARRIASQLVKQRKVAPFQQRDAQGPEVIGRDQVEIGLRQRFRFRRRTDDETVRTV